MATLNLTLKKKWFDMIKSGEKLEEYRETKPFWATRLMLLNGTKRGIRVWEYESIETDKPAYSFRKFDTVTFRNGYGKNAPTVTVECLGISIGTAKPEWSDNWQGQVFVIRLGKIINPELLKTK